MLGKKNEGLTGRKSKKFSLKPKYVLVILLFLCAGLIVVSFRFPQQLSGVRAVIGDVLTPMQGGINQVGSYLSEKADIFTSKKELLSENEKLKAELASMSYENKMLKQQKYELESLRKLYELDNKYDEYEKVAARVTSKTAGNWYSTFTIDKGSNDGIEVDMNVMAGDGLVGIVTKTGHNWATVRSIIDDESRVMGMFLRTSDNCLVSGNLELLDKGYIEVSQIDKDAEIMDGDEVVTAHISDKYLQGILIGYVREIRMDASGLTKSAYLSPSVDFDRLDNVLVITQLKEQNY